MTLFVGIGDVHVVAARDAGMFNTIPQRNDISAYRFGLVTNGHATRPSTPSGYDYYGTGTSTRSRRSTTGSRATCR